MLSEEERGELISIARCATSTQRDALRARIILAAGDGASNSEIAQRLGIAEGTACRWRRRFLESRITGLEDARRTGAPRRIPDGKIQEVIWRTLKCSPVRGCRWSLRTMAQVTGLSSETVRRIWKSAGLRPHRAKSFESAAKTLLRKAGEVGCKAPDLYGAELPTKRGEALSVLTVTDGSAEL